MSTTQLPVILAKQGDQIFVKVGNHIRLFHLMQTVGYIDKYLPDVPEVSNLQEVLDLYPYENLLY